MEISDHEYERLMHRSKLMDIAQDVLIVLNSEGVILDVNEAGANLHGTRVENLIGTNCADLLHPTSVGHMMEVSGGLLIAGVDGTDSMTLRAFRHDGEIVHLELRVSFSNADQKFYVVERDVTDQFQHTSELEALSETLRVLAATDTLTGVPNRGAFDKRMDEIVANDEEGWLTILDVDHFKEINDTFGHVAGDEVLKTIASDVSRLLHSNEILARIGGDEFAIVSPVTDEVVFEDRLRQISAVVNRKFDLDTAQVNVTCSLGASRRVRGEGTTDWLRRSDNAMYANKAAGAGWVAA